MPCVICKTGRTAPGQTTVTLSRDAGTVVIKAVSEDICDTCGEYFLTEGRTRGVREMAERAVRHGVAIEIVQYAA